MGCFQVGAEVCNNCVHWMCPDDRDFKGNPITDVYTACNCAECRKSHRKTLSDGTCPVFHHIGEVKNTFPYVKKETASTGNAFLQAVLKYQHDLAAVSEIEGRRDQCEHEELNIDGEDELEFANAMADLGRANDRVQELVSEGMDHRNMFKDVSVEFMQMLDRAKGGSAKDQYLFAELFRNGTHGALKEGDETIGSGYWYFRNALKNGYSLVYRWCRRSAEQGFAPAEYLLGELERDGGNEGHDGGSLNARKNYPVALEWFAKAASHGLVKAKRAYSNLKERAYGDADVMIIAAVRSMIDGNSEESVRLFSLASNSVIRESDGWGVERFSETLSDFLPDLVACVIDEVARLADNGYSLARSVLGRIYVHASGFDRICPEDFQKGYEWLLKAKDDGDEFASEYLNTSKRARDYASSLELAKTVDDNNIASLLKSGYALMHGKGAGEDRYKAAELFSKAVELGSSEARFLMAECLREEEGNGERRLELYRDAARRWFATTIGDSSDPGSAEGNSYGESCHRIAEYYEGEGDGSDAAKWFRFAARSGLCKAAKSLGYNYLKGSYGFDVDLQNAVYWLQIACWLNISATGWDKDDYIEDYLDKAKGLLDGECWRLEEIEDKDIFIAGCQGDPAGQYQIGCWMADGTQGFAEDLCAAMAWWYRAAKQGHIEAQKRMAAEFLRGSDDVARDIKAASEWYQRASDLGDAEAKDVLKDLEGENYDVQ